MAGLPGGWGDIPPPQSLWVWDVVHQATNCAQQGVLLVGRRAVPRSPTLLESWMHLSAYSFWLACCSLDMASATQVLLALPHLVGWVVAGWSPWVHEVLLPHPLSGCSFDCVFLYG